MFDKGQSQSAGDNSFQLQSGTTNIMVGVDEKRVREICQEFKEYALKEIANEALAIANERIERLEAKLVPRIASQKDGIHALSDPEIFALLKRIQISATETERDSDYEMLSELLCHRIRNKNNLMNKAAINKAVAIVNQVDDSALSALTIFYFAERFIPCSGSIKDGLSTLDSIFSKLLYNDLPANKEWIDHLELLDAVRQNSFGGLKKLQDYYAEKMDGYWSGGLRTDSTDFLQVQQMIQDNNLPQYFLIPHELDPECVRVPVVQKNEIKNFKFTKLTPKGIETTPFTENQIKCVQSIYEISIKENSAKEKRKQLFYSTLESYPSIKKVIDWWNQINVNIRLTAAGRVLAHANAQRCSSDIPSLE